jgi:hypothetical protein
MLDESKGRIFNDDGTRINPDLIPTPDLCSTCAQNDSHDPEKNILCNLSKADAQGEDVFLCFSYQPNSPSIDRKAVLRKLCEQAGVECTENDLAEPSEDNADPIRF